MGQVITTDVSYMLTDHVVGIFQFGAYLPLFPVFPVSWRLKKADHVLSHQLSSPLIRAVSLSKGNILYVSWYYCVTVSLYHLSTALKYIRCEIRSTQR